VPESEEIMAASFIQGVRRSMIVAPALSLPGTSSILGVAALLLLADGRVTARVRRWRAWWSDDAAWPEAATGTGGYVG
jgi:hypothetical protein